MAFTQITVTGTWKNDTGAAQTGKVRFILLNTITDGVQEIRQGNSVNCTLDGTGSISTALVATNDPTTQPTGAVYQVTEWIGGNAPRIYNITVPYNSPGGTLNLGAVTPATITPSYTYAQLTDVNRLSTYDVSCNVVGAPAAGATVLRFATVRSWQLPQNLTGSAGAAPGVNPAATATFNIKKNGSNIGTVAISTGGVYTFTMASATTFAAGDVITVVAPNPADTNLADFGFTLKGAAL